VAKPIDYEGDKSKIYSMAGRGETFANILARRVSRREALKVGATITGIVVAGVATSTFGQDAAPSASPGASPAASPAASPVASPATGGTAGGSSLTFAAIDLDASDQLVVAAGHTAVPFLRWGDPITAAAPEFDVANQTAASQAQQFGYNCDWIGFLPLPQGSPSYDRGLLVVNHEYTNAELMFPGYLTPDPAFSVATPGATPGVSASPEPPSQDDATPSASPAPATQAQVPPLIALDFPGYIPNPTPQIVDVELEAHGLSIVEVVRGASGAWDVVLDSPYNRRITGTTPTEVTGPAAGADLMKTTVDPTGIQVMGTLNNCAGGTTPWGTIITGEENFQQYFANLSALPPTERLFALHERFGINETASPRQWELFHPRFDLAQEPHEPFRFGWGVEIDPYDPTFVPKKRTALGRNKHEGHTSVVSPGGQVAIYSGDDERFEYAYKFITAGTFNPSDRAANMNLLDAGTLYAAKFNDDGTGEWLPLVFGEGQLTAAYGIGSQADVLINTRFAADLVGATKMDRPEDFETNPVTGKVYLVCTNNDNRELDQADRANPRTNNLHGHIIEITEAGNDPAATTFIWEMFLLAGDPAAGSTWYGGFDQEMVSPFSAPDNIAFDIAGNLWISTDGNSLDANDGLYAVAVEGAERGYVKQFFSSSLGAEVTGPYFNDDSTTLFVAVQHPGEGGTYEEPVSQWPDGDGPPRPSVVVIQADNGGRVGGA